MQALPQNENSDADNKRYAPRWHIQTNCVYQMHKDSAACKGHVKDVSCAGARVTTNKRVPVNQNVNLTLYLPDKGAVNVCGTAVWEKVVNSVTEIGIHFFNTSSEAQETILRHAINANNELFQDHLFKGWA